MPQWKWMVVKFTLLKIYALAYSLQPIASNFSGSDVILKSTSKHAFCPQLTPSPQGGFFWPVFARTLRCLT
jgi:hypothetical protein